MKGSLGIYYDRSSDFQQAQFDALKVLIRENVDLSAVTTMLDIGCGTGARTVECFDVFSKLRHITAFDPDPEMISVARADHANPRVEYKHMAADGLDTLSGDFDAIISNWVLHWIEDKTRLMTDLANITHKGSVFMFGTCENLPLILQDVDVFIRRELNVQSKGKTPFHYLKAEEWTNLLETHGWKIKKQRAYKTSHFAIDAKGYLEHWFAASTAKFLYGHQMEEISDIVMSDLIWLIEEKYRDPNFKDGLLFHENVVFTVAERL